MASFDVTGMTCEHCVRAVTGAIRQIDPKAEVRVSLDSGRVEVTSAAAAEALDAAIRAEGYDARPAAA